MVSDPIKDWRSENRSDEQGVHKPLKKSDVWIVSVVVALGDPENVGEVWVTVRLLVVCGGWLQSMEKWIPSCLFLDLYVFICLTKKNCKI